MYVLENIKSTKSVALYHQMLNIEKKYEMSPKLLMMAFSSLF